MTKKTRKILFYSSIGLFLLMSTFIVLFALGYGYDFTKNEFLKTGGFGVTVQPGASVYIDDSLAGSTSFLSNSYSKSRLLPGLYDVRLELEGYHSWQKQVEIQEGAFADFPSIILLPSKLTTQLLKTKLLPYNITSLYYYKNSFYFLSGGQLISYNTENDEQKVLVKKVEAFFPNGDILVYRSSDKSFHNFLINKDESETLSLPETDIKNIQKFMNISGATYIIAKTGTGSLLYELRDRRITELAKNISSFEPSPDGSKLLYFNSHEIFVLHLRDSGYQPYKQSGQKYLLTRTSKTISEIKWHKDSEHIFINASGTLSFTELDNRDVLNSYELSNSIQTFSYDSDNDTIYAFGRRGLEKMDLK